MSYYDHATLMSLKLDRWSEDRFLPHQHRRFLPHQHRRFLPHQHRREDLRPGPTCPPQRRATWLARIIRFLSRQRHART